MTRLRCLKRGMMRSRFMLLLAMTGTFGCAATFWAGNRSATLSLGMSKQQAQTLLGSPQQVISQDAQGIMVETWKYLDRILVFHDGLLYSVAAQSSAGTAP